MGGKSMIYVAVTPCSNGYTRYFKTDKDGLKRLYEDIADFTDDISVAKEVTSWAEFASIGEVLENKYFKAEIIED